MFGLDPLTRPVALIEILLLLSAAAMLGWLLTRLLFIGRIRELETAIAEEELALEACRRTSRIARTQPVPAGESLASTHTSPRPDTVSNYTTLMAKSEADQLARMAARSTELNYDRIGLAEASSADNLQEIMGIGPFLERRLHAIGIYTFRQIANFTEEDIERVNEIIEFFPGRVEREDWVGQAKAFYNRKLGA